MPAGMPTPDILQEHRIKRRMSLETWGWQQRAALTERPSYAIDIDDTKPLLVPIRGRKEERDDDERLHWSIKWAVGLLIVCNAAFLGLCTNASDDDDATANLCQESEHFFTAMFLLECFVKLFLLRITYFYSGWNWIDFLLLLSSILDVWVLSPIVGRGGASQLGKGTAFRLFRLVRVMRIFKLLKQRQELLILIEGLGAAFGSMVWVAFLLVIVIYGGSLFCVSLFRDIQTNTSMSFQDVPNAMFTMFTIGTLADWTDLVTPVIEQYAWAGPFFIIFALVTNFALLNLVIGVITERTQQVNEKYVQNQYYQADLKRMGLIEDLAAVVFEGNAGNIISFADLDALVRNADIAAKIQQLLLEVDLPLGFSVTDLHNMLDRDGTGCISRHDFLQGMARIVFCSEFQQNCLIQATLASLRVQMKAMLDDAVSQLRAELAASSSSSGRAPRTSHDGAPGLTRAASATVVGEAGARRPKPETERLRGVNGDTIPYLDEGIEDLAGLDSVVADIAASFDSWCASTKGFTEGPLATSSDGVPHGKETDALPLAPEGGAEFGRILPSGTPPFGQRPPPQVSVDPRGAASDAQRRPEQALPAGGGAGFAPTGQATLTGLTSV